MNKYLIVCMLSFAAAVAAAIGMIMIKNQSSLEKLPHASALQYDTSCTDTEAVVTIRTPFNTGSEGKKTDMGNYSIITFPVYDAGEDGNGFTLVSYIPEEESTHLIEKAQKIADEGIEEITIKGIMVDIEEMYSLCDEERKESFYSKMKEDAIAQSKLNHSYIYDEDEANRLVLGQMTLLITNSQKPKPSKPLIIACMSLSVLSFLVFLTSLFTYIRRMRP